MNTKTKKRAPGSVPRLVRLLEWRKIGTPQERHYGLQKLAASTPFGFFVIQKYWRGGFIWGFERSTSENPITGGSHYWKLSQAKNAAQEHFDYQVRECLSNTE